MISDFSQRIEVRRPALPGDFGFGDDDHTETSVLTTWASIKEVNRFSAVKQDLDTEVNNYKVRIRYNAGRDIEQEDFIVWNGKRYKAKTSPSVLEIDKKRFLEFIMVAENG